MKKLECFIKNTCLYNELIRTVHEKPLISEKSCLFYCICTNIDKIEIILVLHDRVALLMRKHSEHETRNRASLCRKVWIRYKNLIRRLIFDDSDETEIRLPY